MSISPQPQSFSYMVTVDHSNLQTRNSKCSMSFSEVNKDGTIMKPDEYCTRTLLPERTREHFHMLNTVHSCAISILFEDPLNFEGSKSSAISKTCFVENPEAKSIIITLEGNSEGIRISNRVNWDDEVET